jgi:hypothetical protein
MMQLETHRSPADSTPKQRRYLETIVLPMTTLHTMRTLRDVRKDTRRKSATKLEESLEIIDRELTLM